jgi:hypothetical protein
MSVSAVFFNAFGWSRKDYCSLAEQPSATMLCIPLEIHKPQRPARIADENWYSMFPVS